MVRFSSCFHPHSHSNKTKKTVQLSVEALDKTLEDYSQNQDPKDCKDFSGLDTLQLKVQVDGTPNNSSDSVICSSSMDDGWKAEEINDSNKFEGNKVLHYSCSMKKSMSLGSGLDRGVRDFVGNNSEDEMDVGYSYDGSIDHDKVVVPVSRIDPEVSMVNQFQEALPSYSPQVGSDLVNNGSIFSLGDAHQFEKGHDNYDNYDNAFSSGDIGESSDHTPHDPPIIVKSKSLPNISCFGRNSARTLLAAHSRSSEDLIALDLRQRDNVIHEVEGRVIHGQERDDSILNNEKSSFENHAGGGYDSYNYVGLAAKDWIIPAMDESNADKHLQEESSAGQWKELPSKDFKNQRIQEWVIGLQHCNPLEETADELSNLDDNQVQRGATVVDKLTSGKSDEKIIPGLEAAKKYIASLSATATTAQLASHGLAMIPFLGAFMSLRALNLSGNSIVRITAGALPRGLHILNLSRNKISIIEGLRELTRLRVLDLSYNRIVRIGHGLAYCSSLKELYLAGNKISEVEGLHRLLKLNVLDLRFNKFCTAKCLGQLAANYNSLQAISLEGNPAQRNVGDEQLKKYLLGLLPHLAYYNRHSIKASVTKDGADRSARLGIMTDRGHRSDHKTLRKGNHGASAHRTSISSSIHGRRSQAVIPAKLSKEKPSRLPPPPTGTKTWTAHRHNFHDFSSKLLSFKTDLSMRRSRSEGTLAAL
ncbi:hypothetical protein NMG60_11003059 [Bertholletia excelsa]